MNSQEDDNTEGSSKDLANVQIPATESKSIAFDESNNISINILSREELAKCPFWVGVFRKGMLSPLEILDTQGVSDVFAKSAIEGIREDEPILLTDNSLQLSQPRFFYFVPENSLQAMGSLNFTEKLTKTICDIQVKHLGLYLAAEIFQHETGQQLLIKIIELLIKNSGVRDYYLYPGGHGTNAVLNVALHAKKLFESDHSRIFVFH